MIDNFYFLLKLILFIGCKRWVFHDADDHIERPVDEFGFSNLFDDSSFDDRSDDYVLQNDSNKIKPIRKFSVRNSWESFRIFLTKHYFWTFFFSESKWIVSVGISAERLTASLSKSATIGSVFSSEFCLMDGKFNCSKNNWYLFLFRRFFQMKFLVALQSDTTNEWIFHFPKCPVHNSKSLLPSSS